MGIENLGAYARSSSRSCMIGYVNFYTPTASPTPVPTANPSSAPSSFPTLPTTVSPTSTPSYLPSAGPSSTPTSAFPTTAKPTTVKPTSQPTAVPVTNTPTLPTTSTPTANPSFAPTMPPTLIHLTQSWGTGLSSSGGSCTYSGGITQFLSYGTTSWKYCIYNASAYGAMLFGSQYTGWGWGAHRTNANAEYVTSWPTYSTLSIYTPGACILARDPSAGTTRNLIPTNSITYENDVL